MAELLARFVPGAMVRVDDIEMRVIAVEFSWGMTFPRYECQWFADGAIVTRWIHEPELEAVA